MRKGTECIHKTELIQYKMKSSLNFVPLILTIAMLRIVLVQMLLNGYHIISLYSIIAFA